MSTNIPRKNKMYIMSLPSAEAIILYFIVVVIVEILTGLLVGRVFYPPLVYNDNNNTLKIRVRPINSVYDYFYIFFFFQTPSE